MSKQTAVEWLAKELTSLNWDYLTGSVDNKTYNLRYTEILEQAKEMEKKQIMDAFENGENKSAELYYNENYGGNNE